jgi:hypothetical protein
MIRPVRLAAAKTRPATPQTRPGPRRAAIPGTTVTAIPISISQKAPITTQSGGRDGVKEVTATTISDNAAIAPEMAWPVRYFGCDAARGPPSPCLTPIQRGMRGGVQSLAGPSC